VGSPVASERSGGGARLAASPRQAARIASPSTTLPPAVSHHSSDPSDEMTSERLSPQSVGSRSSRTPGALDAAARPPSERACRSCAGVPSASPSRLTGLGTSAEPLPPEEGSPDMARTPMLGDGRLLGVGAEALRLAIAQAKVNNLLP